MLESLSWLLLEYTRCVNMVSAFKEFISKMYLEGNISQLSSKRSINISLTIMKIRGCSFYKF